MQIVIDIPDNHNFKEDVKIAYELIRHREDIPLGTIGFLNMLYQRIDKIISLPKRHGRLKDIDKLKSDGDIVTNYNYRSAVSWEQIIDAPIVLEADKEDEDADCD